MAAKGIVNIDDMIRELIVLFGHKPRKDVEVVNAIKNDRLVFYKIVFVFQKHAWDLGIMKRRVKVVDGMVSIVPAILVVYIIDTIEYTAEMTFRIILVNERMLCPVAHHHDKTCIDHWNDKDHHGGLEVDKAHQHAK